MTPAAETRCMRLFSVESPIERFRMAGRKRRRPVRTPRARCGGLERDLVVGIAAATRSARRLSVGRPLAIAPAVEEGQHTVIWREMDLGAVAVRARLVLPLAGGQLALEVDFRAFLQVVSGRGQPPGLNGAFCKPWRACLRAMRASRCSRRNAAPCRDLH